MSWKMELCLNETADLVEKTFENLEDGYDWLRQNWPTFFRPGVFAVHRADFHQLGTGYSWVAFTRG